MPNAWPWGSLHANKRFLGGILRPEIMGASDNQKQSEVL